MKDVTILNQTANSLGWQFTVTVGCSGGDREIKIALDQEFYQRVTRGRIDPDQFVIQTVKFILRESRINEFSSIINIQSISKKIPEFEKEIQKKVESSSL